MNAHAAGERRAGSSYALIAMLLTCTAPAQLDPLTQASQSAASTGERHVILSVSHPRDSEGQIVYEAQGPSQLSVPVVPGNISLPRLTHQVGLKFPKSMRKQKIEGSVVVEGVVTERGDFIDSSVVETTPSSLGQDAHESALNATGRYRYAPAMLDGKPVPFLIRISVQYRIF